MDVDWEAEINATHSTPTDVLRWFLHHAAHIDDIVVVAHFDEQADADVADTVVARSNSAHAYRRIGLLHDALNMNAAQTHDEHSSLETE